MTATTKSIRRPTVTLQLPKSVPALIVHAQGIVERMTGNTAFPNPTPSLTAVTAAVDALRTVEFSPAPMELLGQMERNDGACSRIGHEQVVCTKAQPTLGRHHVRRLLESARRCARNQHSIG